MMHCDKKIETENYKFVSKLNSDYTYDDYMAIFKSNIDFAKKKAKTKIINCLKNNEFNKKNDFKIHFEIEGFHFFVYDMTYSSCVKNFSDISRIYNEILDCMESYTHIINIDIYDMEMMKMVTGNELFLVKYKDTYIGTYFNWENTYSSISFYRNNIYNERIHRTLREYNDGIYCELKSRLLVKEYDNFKFVIEAINKNDEMIPCYYFKYYIVFPYFHIVINNIDAIKMLAFDNDMCELITSLYAHVNSISIEQKKNIIKFLGRTVNILFNPVVSFKNISAQAFNLVDNFFVLNDKNGNSNEKIKEKNKFTSNLIYKKIQGMQQCNVDKLKKQNPLMSKYNVIDFDIGGVIEDKYGEKEFIYVKTRLGNISFYYNENIFPRHKKILEEKYEKFKYTQKKLNSKNFL